MARKNWRIWRIKKKEREREIEGKKKRERWRLKMARRGHQPGFARASTCEGMNLKPTSLDKCLKTVPRVVSLLGDHNRICFVCSLALVYFCKWIYFVCSALVDFMSRLSSFFFLYITLSSRGWRRSICAPFPSASCMIYFSPVSSSPSRTWNS